MKRKIIYKVNARLHLNKDWDKDQVIIVRNHCIVFWFFYGPFIYTFQIVHQHYDDKIILKVGCYLR